MNIILWVLQAGLAFMYISGGAFKVFKTPALAGHFRAFPQNAWRTLGAIEIVGGILLVVPATLSGIPVLTAAAATLLAIETLTLAAAYAMKSVKLVAANPFTWCAPMGILAALVAWGRFA